MLFCSLSLMKMIPVLILLIVLFRQVCRWIIFRKMGLRPWLGIIPGAREFMIFRHCWKVWPFLALLGLTIVAGFIVQTTAYMDISLPIPPFIKSNLTVVSLICLMTITVMMYKHLAFAFGRDIGYVMGLLFLNPVFLAMLAFSKKNTFHEELTKLSRKELKEYTMKNRSLRNRILSAVSAVVIVCSSIGYIGYVMFDEHQPGFLIEKKLSRVYDKTSGIVNGNGKVMYPAIEVGGLQYGKNAAPEEGVREHYFEDKSKVSETTVYMYLIGSDLEDTIGSASVNLAQIKDATAAGSGVKFIIEAGGSGRWFTDGFKKNRTARYMIKDGEVTLLETLPSNTSMSKQKTLSDFLIWANKTYPSDRKMLFFWNHGGGLAGFGVDIINPGKPSDKLLPSLDTKGINSLISSRKAGTMLSMADISRALQEAGDRYDLIAFDACLMQTMEVAKCLEPYADYLLASEESEPSVGMYYTAAFSRLARQPNLDTPKFGAMMCSSYDQTQELLNDGTPQAGYTLSMTDLRYIPVVEDTFLGYLNSLDSRFRGDKRSFINMSTARSQAYEFQMEDQIDLIDFLYQSDIPDEEKESMIRQISKAITVRSAASANHINGLAVYMPYDDLYTYSNLYEDMEELGMDEETEVYNDFASIIGSQKTTKDGSHAGYFKNEKWYVEGFENYDISVYRGAIPLTKAGDTYKIDLSVEQRESIIDYEEGLRIKVGRRYADLGSRKAFASPEGGGYELNYIDHWFAIDNVLVAIHPGVTRKSEDGQTVHTGTVDASMNFIEPITIYVEWINLEDGGIDGKILGYLPSDEDSDDIDESGMPRGVKQFKASNIVTFVYDWYDADGNYLSTALGHLPINVGMYGLEMSRIDISKQEYECYGILHDIMNRTLKTEVLHHEKKE